MSAGKSGGWEQGVQRRFEEGRAEQELQAEYTVGQEPQALVFLVLLCVVVLCFVCVCCLFCLS